MKGRKGMAASDLREGAPVLSTHRDGPMAIYYLSFQRAPPLKAAPGEVISVSPTIVNDLREDVYLPEDGGSNITICFAWLVKEASTTCWHESSIAARTTWEGPQSAYKTVQLTVPKEATASDLCLALWVEGDESSKGLQGQSSKRRKKEASAAATSHIIKVSNMDLHSEDVQILPVLSAPIEVSKKISNFTGKSSNTTRLLTLGDGEVVEICEEAGYELDKHIWDASLLLSDHLEDALRSEGELFRALVLKESKKGLRVVELGAGTGLVTVCLSSLLAKTLTAAEEDERRVHLTATDLDSALPLLQRNIDRNSSLYGSKGVCIDCQPLDWTEECTIAGADVVLVSDCTYNPTYFEPLCRTIKSLLEKGQPGCFCLLAKKHRHADEEALWTEMSRCHLDYTLLSGQQDVEGGQWGLWRLSTARSL